MKKMMIYLLCLSAMSAWSVSAQPPLKLLTSPFEPYIWCDDEKNATKGIDVDILSELFRQIGQPYSIRCGVPWTRALKMVENGDADGVFPGFETPERKAFAYYLDDPLHMSQYVIFTKRGQEFPFETIDDLAGKKIGIDRVFNVSPAFDTAAQTGKFKVEEVSTPEQNLKKLLKGRIDAYVNNRHVVLYTAKQLGMLEHIVALPHPVTKGRPSYLMLSKTSAFADKPVLIQRLNQVLHEMWQDGTIERLTSQYIQ